MSRSSAYGLGEKLFQWKFLIQAILFVKAIKIKISHALFWGNTIIYALATISNTKKNRQLIVNVKTEEGKLQQIY